MKLQKSCLVWNHYPNFRAKLFWVFLSHMCRWSNHAICLMVIPTLLGIPFYIKGIFIPINGLMTTPQYGYTIQRQGACEQSASTRHRDCRPKTMEISNNNHGDSCSSNHNGNMTKQKPKESTKNHDIQASWDNDAIIQYSIYESIKSISISCNHERIVSSNKDDNSFFTPVYINITLENGISRAVAQWDSSGVCVSLRCKRIWLQT